ncbi:MAG: hypothetical protein Kow00129_00710 [Thermoleophilia bacterium]
MDWKNGLGPRIRSKKVVLALSLAAGLAVLSLVAGFALVSEGGAEDRAFSRFGFHTDTSRHSIDLDRLVSGGPGKDGIPALTQPEFVPAAEVSLDEGVRGILVEFEGQRRFYPFNIMVWHEVVNDRIGDEAFAVTFCPLCGSGIVFDREVEGKVLEFGVSGFLYESNLVMYDRETHSFWPQSLGEAVAGKYTGTRLDILPMQLLTFGEASEKYSDLQLLSEDTGYVRDYRRNPYAGYEETESLLFPVSVEDKRFFAKELMYVFRLDQSSVAFPLEQLGPQGASVDLKGRQVKVTRDGGEITVTVDGEEVPGYVEMWFSWATQHQEDGLVWEPDEPGAENEG